MFNFSSQVSGKIYYGALQGWKNIPIARDEPDKWNKAQCKRYVYHALRPYETMRWFNVVKTEINMSKTNLNEEKTTQTNICDTNTETYINNAMLGLLTNLRPRYDKLHQVLG